MRATRPISVAILLLAAVCAGASAQNSGDRTGTIPAAALGGQPDAREWSGEDGASGHPLMTAAAIRQAAADFQPCLERLWPQAARHGVSRMAYQSLTAHLSPDLRIMDLLDSQPEFTKAVWDYLDILVNDTRVAKGRAM